MCGVIPAILPGPAPADSLSPSQRLRAVDILLCVCRGLVMRRDVPLPPSCASALSSAASDSTLAASLGQLKSWQEVFLEVVCVAITANIPVSGRPDEAVSVGMMIAEKFSVMACEQPCRVTPLLAGAAASPYSPRTPLSITSSNCTLMWRQRLWSRLHPRLTPHLQAKQTVSSDISTAILLVCVCSLAAEMPVKVIASSLLDLSRFAIIGLTLAVGLCPADANGQVDHSSAVFRCRFLLRQKCVACILSGLLLHTSDSNAIESVFVPHVHSLVPLLIQVVYLCYRYPPLLFTYYLSACRYLQIVQSEKSSLGGSAAVRALCLQCLQEMIRLPYNSIHPVRKNVVNGLSFALDDPKRAVRKLAAKVRNAWIVMDGK